MARPAAYLVLAAVLLVPAATAASDGGSAEAPDWYEAGITTLKDDLYREGPGALVETRRPIDQGDVWAWSGDNGKALGALAHSHRRSGPMGERLVSFVDRLTEGPLVFQRTVNTHDPVVVAANDARYEVSNHLITLRGEPGSAPTEGIVEYHDGRDRRMITFGPPALRTDDGWTPLGPYLGSFGVEDGSDARGGEVTVWRRYRLGSTTVYANLTLDASPRIERAVTVLGAGDAGAVALRSPDLGITRPELPSPVLRYTHAFHAERGDVPVGRNRAPVSAADIQAAPWILYRDPSAGDAFAPALGVRVRDPGAFVRAHVTDLAASPGTGDEPRQGIGSLRHVYELPAGDGTAPLVEDWALLDGHLTDRPSVYGSVVPNLTAERYERVDPSLSYEVGATARGLAAYADAAGSERATALAVTQLETFLDRVGDGPQTRSLASATLAATTLASVTDDPTWLREARDLGELLRSYQIREQNHPATGGLGEGPQTSPRVDATALAGVAWTRLARETGNRTYLDWASQAWGSLEPGTTSVVVRGHDGRIAGSNHWVFKDGLLLQAGDALPDDVRWAARNHVWEVLRDRERVEVGTSAFSVGTNSETQSWALQGMLADHRARDLPWILDSETPLAPVPSPEGATRLRPNATGAWVWADPGHVPHVDGAPPPRAEGPHETVRWTATGPMTFWPSHAYNLTAGWNALGFPGLGTSVPPSRLMDTLPVEVAWAWDAASRSWRPWVPDRDLHGGLDSVDRATGLLVALHEPATLHVADRPGPPPAPAPGWNLLPLPGGAGSDDESPWGNATVRGPPIPGEPAGAGDAEPFFVVLVGQDATAPPPGPPPAVVAGTVTEAWRGVRGGVLEVRADGALVAEATVGPAGDVQATVEGLDPGTGLRITYRDADGTLAETTRTYAPGAYIPADLEVDPRSPASPPAWIPAAFVAGFVASVLVLLGAGRD